MAAIPTLGSPEWAEFVYSTPPVDTIKGRTRWTQAHQPWSDVLERFAPVQGRPEYIGYLALEYLWRLGLIARFKEHAFQTTKADLGWETRPDFLASDGVPGHFVIEVKTARFVTGAVELELKANREAFARFGLTYIVWTDHRPLTKHLRHNLIQMRRCDSEDVSDEERDDLREFVKSEGQLPLSTVLGRDYDLTTVFSAWWRGLIFLPLAASLTGTTPVSVSPLEDLRRLFFAERMLADDWWDNLPTA